MPSPPLPSLPPLAPPPLHATWQELKNTNCHSDGHGAIDLDDGNAVSGITTAADCKHACVHELRCVGVRVFHPPWGQFECHRAAFLVLNACDTHDPNDASNDHWTVYLRMDPRVPPPPTRPPPPPHASALVYATENLPRGSAANLNQRYKLGTLDTDDLSASGLLLHQFDFMCAPARAPSAF